MSHFTASEGREREAVVAMRELLSLKVKIPTVGGRAIEAMSDARLLRFLRARKFDVAKAVEQYAAYLEYRVSTFGMRDLERHEAHDCVRVVVSSSTRLFLLLDLGKLDLGGDKTPGKYDKEVGLIIESIWFRVDEALESATAQLEGIHVVVDARRASPQKHLRPQRLREVIGSLVDRVPARIRKIDVVGAPRWLQTSWFALGPILKSKLVARATMLSVDDANASLPDQVLRAMDDTHQSSSNNKNKSSSNGPVVVKRSADKGHVHPEEKDDAKDDDDDTVNDTFPPGNNKKTGLQKQTSFQQPNNNAPLTRDRVLSIQLDCDAKDIPIPNDIDQWEEDDVIVYFATDGTIRPNITSLPTRRRSSHQYTSHRHLYS